MTNPTVRGIKSGHGLFESPGICYITMAENQWLTGVKFHPFLSGPAKESPGGGAKKNNPFAWESTHLKMISSKSQVHSLKRTGNSSPLKIGCLPQNETSKSSNHPFSRCENVSFLGRVYHSFPPTNIGKRKNGNFPTSSANWEATRRRGCERGAQPNGCLFEPSVFFVRIPIICKVKQKLSNR